MVLLMIIQNHVEYCEGQYVILKMIVNVVKKKEKCKDLKCGYGRTNNRNRDDNYCKNEKWYKI